MSSFVNTDKTIEVANVVGSSGHRGNWKDKWLRNAGRRQWPPKCQFHGRGNEATIGGHMYVKYKTGNKHQYLLPICAGCNNDRGMDWDQGKTQWAEVKANAMLVTIVAHDSGFNEKPASKPASPAKAPLKAKSGGIITPETANTNLR